MIVVCDAKQRENEGDLVLLPLKARAGGVLERAGLAGYCRQHGLTMVTVGDLIAHHCIANDEERMRWQWEG